MFFLNNSSWVNG